MEVAIFVKETRNKRPLTSLFDDFPTKSQTKISQKVLAKDQWSTIQVNVGIDTET